MYIYTHICIYTCILKLPFISPSLCVQYYPFSLGKTHSPWWVTRLPVLSNHDSQHQRQMWIHTPSSKFKILQGRILIGSIWVKCPPLGQSAIRAFVQTPWLPRRMTPSKRGLFFSEQGQKDGKQTQLYTSTVDKLFACKDMGGWNLF